MKKIFTMLIPIMTMLMLIRMPVLAENNTSVQIDRIISAESGEAAGGGIMTDQTGDFVSIFIVGENLTKETVRPVIYDEVGNVISGEVKAVEKSRGGSYFRIEKLNLDAWDLKTAEDGKKAYRIEVEAVGECEIIDTRTDKMVEIERRDMYYHCHNNNNCTISMYLADDLNLDENHVPVMQLEPADYDFASPKKVTGQMKKVLNPLTGVEETKAVFSFTRNALVSIREDYSYEYVLAITDGDETIVEIPNKLGNHFEYQGEPIETFESGRKEFFYLPYWIGAVYEIDGTSELVNYYISKEDSAALGEFMYAKVGYPLEECEYDLSNTDHSRSMLRYEYNFFTAADVPEKPVGVPENVMIEKVDKDHVRITWEAVEGATEYGIYVQKLGDEKNRWIDIDTSNELTYVCDISCFKYIYGEVKGDFLFRVRPIARKNEYIVLGDFSDQVMYTVYPQIEGISVKGYSANYDGKSHTITITGVPKGAKVTYATSSTGAYTTTKPKRTNVGVTKVYYKIEKENYETLTGMVRVIIRPKAPTQVNTNLYKYNAVQVKWNKVAGASGYAVYYKKASASTYTLMQRTTSLSLKKASLAAGTKYTFKVVPYVTADNTRYLSNGIKTSSIYTLKKVAMPTVSRRTSSKVRLKWKDINGERGYQISRSTSKTGTNTVATFVTPKGMYKDISATKGKTYYYKVRAYVVVNGQKIYGPWSDVKKYKIAK